MLPTNPDTSPASNGSNAAGSPAEQESRQATVAKCAAFAVLAWMFLPILTGRIYVCDDLQNYHLPIRQFYADCLTKGDSFDWMPNLFSGFFLTGSGQGGTYHPLHYLLYRCLPLGTAFNLEILLSYPFMLFGMQSFLRRHLIRRDAAWLGAIVFTFSGFCTLHFLHPNAVAVVAHIPWLLLVQDVLLRPHAGPRRWRIPAEVSIALLTGSQLLLGYPQYVWFSLLAEISLCIGLADRNWTGIRKLLLISLLKCFGLGLGAVQLLPSMAALAESDRAALPPEFFFQHPLSLADMLQWIGPFLTKSRVFGANTHELGVYCGAIPVLLALSLIRPRSQTRSRPDAGTQLLIPMLCLGLIALWLSFGRDGGLYVVQTWLPLIGKFRYPSRIVVLLHLVLAVLAAIGFARLMKESASHEVGLPGLISVVPWIGAGAAAGVWLLGDPDNAAPWTLMIIGPVLFFLAALMVKDLARGRISAGFMLFLAGDLAAYGFTYEALQNTKSWKDVIASLNQPPGSPADGRIVAEIQIADGDIGYEGNDLLLAGWHQADGYEGLLPQSYLLDQNTSLESLRISGVRWINSGGNHSRIAGLQPTDDSRWLAVPNPLPRARFTVNTATIADPLAAVRKLQPEGFTVVDRDLEIPQTNDTAPGAATIVVDRPGRIEIQTSADSPRLLVLSERFSDGWNATVDGATVPIVRAEIDFMGCVAPVGDHMIRFTFDPASVHSGRLISTMTLLLLCLFAACRVMTLKRRRNNLRRGRSVAGDQISTDPQDTESGPSM
ncbi:MAG: hypothetical protein H7Z17_13610 [Fuerstia sp.]|nr:hypothetical protein [Fuerstiella sp.]